MKGMDDDDSEREELVEKAKAALRKVGEVNTSMAPSNFNNILGASIEISR